MVVCRVGMIGTERVHGVIIVRHLSRGEIGCPTAARGVPVQYGKKKGTVSQLFSCGNRIGKGRTFQRGVGGRYARSLPLRECPFRRASLGGRSPSLRAQSCAWGRENASESWSLTE
jgi:hypothetical protein